MIIKSKVGTDIVDITRGSGALGYKEDYLQFSDPATYYYEKFKRTSNKYLSDDMWTEAAKRGETASLVDLLNKRQVLDKKITETPIVKGQQVEIETDWYNKWKNYEGYNDYDSYMLSLSIPILDNETKKLRIDEETGYEFGEYTDKEWAIEILNSQFGRYDAEIIEEKKRNQNFFETVYGYLGSGIHRILAGFTNFTQDIYNIGEGLVNIFINWSNDKNIGSRFLAAFGDDEKEFLANLTNDLEQTAFQFERDYGKGLYDSVEGYETGKGYSTWGRWYTGGLQSIGYMLPTILLTRGLGNIKGLSSSTIKAIGSGTFYGGIASGNIKDTIEKAKLSGLTYQDLNSLEVIGNGMGKAVAQWGVEVILGKILGWSFTDKALRGGRIAEGAVKVGTTELSALGTFALRAGKSAAKEGLEEVLQDLSDGLIDYFYRKGKSNLSDIYNTNVREKWNIQNLFDAFVVGALTDVAIGSFNSLKYINPRNRIIGSTTANKGYKLGMFQTMNFAQAMQTMTEWNNTLNDGTANVDKKSDAALKMSVAIKTLGSLFESMGTERTIAANNILVGYLNEKAKSNETQKLYNANYATSLFNKFNEQRSEIVKKYVSDNLKAKIEKQLDKQKDTLKEANVNSIENVITEKIVPEDSDIEVTSDKLTILKNALKQLGVEAIVGVNGQIITKSEDILFVDNNIVLNGDLVEIVKGIAYDQVINTVRLTLNISQRNMILDLYNKVTGLDGTMKDAITALLFDKFFYTKVLLLSGERRYSDSAIELLATIDKVTKTKAISELDNGTLTTQAYKTLITKVYETMKTGLIYYSTQYVNLDLDKISNEVLSIDIKNEIRNNKNVIFTNIVNDSKLKIKNKVLDKGDIQRYSFYLNKFVDTISKEEVDKLNSEIRSTDYNKKLDAWTALEFMAKISKDADYNKTKLVMLSTRNTDLSLHEEESIEKLEDLFGMSLDKLANGDIKLLQLNNLVISIINKNGYTPDEFINDITSRLSCLRETLFEISNNTLTLDNTFNIVRVIEKSDFINNKYLVENGNSVFKKQLHEGKINTINDIISNSIEVPDIIKQLEIRYDNTLKSNGSYIDGDNFITIGTTGNLTSLMHEITHVSQYITRQANIDTEFISGGNTEIFKALPYKVAKDLNEYLFENFPITYNLIRKANNKNTFAEVLYFLLQGEIEANASLNSFISMMGFLYKDNKKTLISPDGKKTWSLKVGQVGKNFKVPSMIVEQEKISEDIQLDINYKLSEIAKQTLDNYANKMTTEIQQETIDRLTNQILFKGTTKKGITEFDNTLGEKKRIVKGAIWLTDNKNVAETYQSKDGDLYSMNITINNPLVIDAEGQYFSKLGNDLNTDSIASYGLQNGYDSVIINNVIDLSTYVSNITDRKNAIKPSTDIVIFSNNNISNLTSEDISKTNLDTYIKEKGLFKKEVDVKTIAQKVKKQKEYYRRRYVSNKLAKESNLKYFIKKGKPILMDPTLQEFIIATTDGFDKLPIVLKDKIKNGTLTYDSLIDYINTASNIDNYTFKKIAKHFFNNNELATITFKDTQKLIESITELSSLAFMTDDPNIKMTPKEIFDFKDKLEKDIQGNTDISKQYIKANKLSTTIRILDDKGNKKVHEALTDTERINSLFFRYYNGTLNSLRDINNLGKYAAFYDWTTKQEAARTDYEYDNIIDESLEKTLGTIDKVDKINAIEKYLFKVLAKKLRALPSDKKIEWTASRIQNKIDSEVDKLYDLSEDELNKKYLIATRNIVNRQEKLEQIIAPIKVSKVEPTTKNLKDQLRNLGRTITTRIAGLKVRYNKLSEIVKIYIDPNNKYKLNSLYRDLTDTELKSLVNEFQKASKELRARIAASDRAREQKATTQERIDRMAKKTMTSKETQTKEDISEKKTLRQKIQVQYKTIIKEQRFSFVTPVDSNNLVKQILNTSWDKTRLSTVKGLSNNKKDNIANTKTFFEQNANILLSATLTEIEDASKWFLTAEISTDKNSEEYTKFLALKMYFLGYVYGQSGPNKLYENINNNLKQQIENELKTEATVAGKMLSVWNNLQGIIDPMNTMKNADMIIDGVTLDSEYKDILFSAIESNDIKLIQDARTKIIDYVESKKTVKKSVLRKIVSFRSMMMLSSPMTWLRNKISNTIIKPLNKVSVIIGDKLFKGPHIGGQLKLNKPITTEIQKFITDNFIDNKLFDSLVSNLSKYNPSDIDERLKTATGISSKEAILTQLVIKSIYNEYYNKNMFKSQFMNDIHMKLIKMMSDDSYIREAAIRYFGKIIAEKGYELKDNIVTDNIMNDFATSIGFALNDYMHSNNMFNNFEKLLSDRSDIAWFAYKTLLPFGAAAWNWFKAAIKLSPVGLGRAIIKLCRLEKNVQKAEIAWQKKQTEVAPELIEYLTKRDLGQGVIGTIGWCLGLLLAGLGYIRLEDDDYGIPKLRLGNITIDVSSIFSTSSLLAGAALVTGIKDEKSFITGLNRMVDYTLDAMPLMEIVQLDMYSQGGFNIGVDTLENIALSYIPNILSWFAGATYSGKLKKNTLWERAIAKIPFLGNLLEKKVDPYTGKEGSWWEAFNRIVPYFSIDIASKNEIKTTALGLNKDQLKGKYTINNNSFNIYGKDLTLINKSYGKWNAIDLEAFYKDNMKIKVKVGNTYQTLSYNQMNQTQRKNAVQTIMSNNAELAKIMAWTKTGNKYYASAELYLKLRKRGVISNVYRGTKGFVKS